MSFLPPTQPFTSTHTHTSEYILHSHTLLTPWVLISYGTHSFLISFPHTHTLSPQTHSPLSLTHSSLTHTPLMHTPLTHIPLSHLYHSHTPHTLLSHTPTIFPHTPLTLLAHSPSLPPSLSQGVSPQCLEYLQGRTRGRHCYLPWRTSGTSS